MVKTPTASDVDDIQLSLDPQFKALGFRKAGRNYRRVGENGLVDVINFSMSRWVNHGDKKASFSVFIGVFVPEVCKYATSVEPIFTKVSHQHCCLTSGFHHLDPVSRLVPLMSDMSQSLVLELLITLEKFAFPFFERFGSRAMILEELRRANYHDYSCNQSLHRCDCAVTAAVMFVAIGEEKAAAKVLRDAIARIEQRSPPRLISETKLISEYQRHAEALGLTKLLLP